MLLRLLWNFPDHEIISLETLVLEGLAQPGLDRQSSQLIIQFLTEHLFICGSLVFLEKPRVVGHGGFRRVIHLQLIQDGHIGSLSFVDALQNRGQGLEFSRKFCRTVAVRIGRVFDVVVVRCDPVHIKQVLHIISHHREFGGDFIRPQQPCNQKNRQAEAFHKRTHRLTLPIHSPDSTLSVILTTPSFPIKY